MKIEFQRAFAVDIQHSYYADGVSADFLVAPTSRCRQLLNRYGLLFKKTSGGFLVLYESSGAVGPPKPKRPLDGMPPLSFVLGPKSPFLLNYSNLPLDKDPDQFFYVSNRQKALSDGQRLLSSASGSGILSEKDLLLLRPQRFQVDVESLADSILWEVVDTQGTLMQRRRVETVEGSNSFLVDLASRPPDRYVLRRDGVEKLAFFAADGLSSGFPFGLIEIANDALVNDEFRFVAGNGEMQFRRFLLRLEARQTTWEYRVVAKYERKLKPTDVIVSLDDPPVTFTRQPAVTLADGTTAIPFVSDGPLPFSQRPLRGITLNKKKGPSTPKLDIDNLPNPSVSEVIQAVGNSVISRVYVYV